MKKHYLHLCGHHGIGKFGVELFLCVGNEILSPFRSAELDSFSPDDGDWRRAAKPVVVVTTPMFQHVFMSWHLGT
jgi:hypothetical protein